MAQRKSYPVNPNGTRLWNVRVHPARRRGGYTSTGHTLPMKHLINIMGEYIKLDYDVNLETFYRDNTLYANLTCNPVKEQSDG